MKNSVDLVVSPLFSLVILGNFLGWGLFVGLVLHLIISSRS
jgi:formate/nitrite transporter FocA (FNT family)